MCDVPPSPQNSPQPPRRRRSAPRRFFLEARLDAELSLTLLLSTDEKDASLADVASASAATKAAAASAIVLRLPFRL